VPLYSNGQLLAAPAQQNRSTAPGRGRRRAGRVPACREPTRAAATATAAAFPAAATRRFHNPYRCQFLIEVEFRRVRSGDLVRLGGRPDELSWFIVVQGPQLRFAAAQS